MVENSQRVKYFQSPWSKLKHVADEQYILLCYIITMNINNVLNYYLFCKNKTDTISFNFVEYYVFINLFQQLSLWTINCISYPIYVFEYIFTIT